ncbi:MAG: hypothetical protein KTR21_13630 [Rhodobacteraceae bacterium]|nr:hypothetical protein [Paracoccaceae bacterium]
MAVAPPLLRSAMVAATAAMAGSLTGCFAHTDAPVFGPERRAAIMGLPGVYAAPNDADDARTQEAAAFEIREEAWGVYRMIGAPASLDPDTLTTMRAFTGDCSGLENADDRAECAQSEAGFCDEENDPQSQAACRRFMGALRGPSSDHTMSQREWGAVEAVRSVAEGLPYRDEVLFTTRTLSDKSLSDDPGVSWAAAQARRVLSIGPLTDFEIFGPQILPLDLLLIRVDIDGLTAFTTKDCVETDEAGDALAPSAPEALDAILLDCAARAKAALTATDSNALERRYFERSE